MGHRLRSLVRVTTTQVDSQSRCCNLQEVSLLNDQMREWNALGAGKLANHGRGANRPVNKLAGVFLFTDHNSARGWSYVINRRGRTSYRFHKGLQDIEGVRVC